MHKQNKLIIAILALLVCAGTMANAGHPSAKKHVVVADTTDMAVSLPDTTESRPVVDNDIPTHSIADEVIWVVGDEPILKSDVEIMRLQGEKV